MKGYNRREHVLISVLGIEPTESSLLTKQVQSTSAIVVCSCTSGSIASSENTKSSREQNIDYKELSKVVWGVPENFEERT